MKILKITSVLLLINTLIISNLIGQNTTIEDLLASRKYNPIRTAVPFLMIAPDSRSAGMGDAGVATTPDEASIYWNPAKLGFIGNNFGASVSYTPWLRQLVDDISLSYLTAHYRIDENQTIGGSIRYFSLGDIQFTDESGNDLNTFNPNEFSITGSYGRKLGEHFAMGISAKFIHSNLTGSSSQTKPGNAYAFDLGMFYTKELRVNGQNALMNYGLSLTNLGSKITYSDDIKNFLPMNLRLGGAFMYEIDEYNSIGATVEFNKLLAPTTTYVSDTLSGGEPTLIVEETSEVSVPVAIFESFYDAPGVNGMSPFEEEVKEINTSIGIEYWYDKKLAFRAGYFYEPQEKGNRKYFTVGTGFRLNVFGIDVAYLIPTTANNPLKNTIRFSLLFNIDAIAQP